MVLFFAIDARKDVITDFSVSLTLISISLEKMFNKEGKSKKVIIIETINPKVIIQPKSIMGLMLLKIKERKAHIVVKTV